MCLDMHTNNSDDAVTDHTRGAPSVESSDMDIDISHPAASHIRTSTVDTEQDAATSNQPADADKGYSAVRQHHKSVPESICQDGTRAEKRLHVWTAKSGVVRTYESPIPRERLTKKMKKRIRKRW